MLVTMVTEKHEILGTVKKCLRVLMEFGEVLGLKARKAHSAGGAIMYTGGAKTRTPAEVEAEAKRRTDRKAVADEKKKNLKCKFCECFECENDPNDPKQKDMPLKARCACHKDSVVDLTKFSETCQLYATGARVYHAKNPNLKDLKGIRISFKRPNTFGDTENRKSKQVNALMGPALTTLFGDSGPTISELQEWLQSQGVDGDEDTVSMIATGAAASKDGVIEMIVEEEPIPDDDEEEVSQQQALMLARDGIAAAQAERAESMAQVAAMEVQLREMRALRLSSFNLRPRRVVMRRCQCQASRCSSHRLQ